VNFYGFPRESLWVNNNGSVTFDRSLSTYTPFGLASTSAEIIAPFFADVDTRAAASQTVRYGWGNTTYEGHRAFCVNWVDVGYYSGHTDKLNSFQLLLVNREDSSDPGDFDIVFNYDKVQWETGDASGGSGGLGGTSAVAGRSPASVQVDCVSGAAVDEVETTTTAGSSSLSYDQLTETYSYVWKTASSWAGSCRTFQMKLDDGSSHQALFKFRT